MARSMVKEMATVLSEAVSKIQAIASGLTVPADHERTYHEHPKPETSVQTSQLTTEPTFITNPEPTQSRQRSHCRGRKRKAANQNFAINTPQNLSSQPRQAVIQTRQPYIGSFPKCPTCNYHHPHQVPCWVCTTCNRYGHLSPQCRNGSMLQKNQTRNQPNPGHACYRCNDPNHLSNQCPQRNNQDSPQQAPSSQSTIDAATQT
jgi:hypothetical protein